jgi:hypothetical protein
MSINRFEPFYNNTSNIWIEPDNIPIFNTSNNIIYNKIKPVHYICEANVPFCSNCGKHGHIFRNCDEPIYSYGLICFYKKKVKVKDNATKFANKKTRKIEVSKNITEEFDNTSIISTTNINSNISIINNKLNSNTGKIKILKRPVIEPGNGIISGTITNSNLTLKNNPIINNDYLNGRFNDNEPYDDIIDNSVDGVIDVEGENMDGHTEQHIEQTIENDETPDDNSEMKEIYVDKVMLVQRKNTIGFIEFLRGKYDVSKPEYIIKLFNMMTYDEKKLLHENDNFDTIRTMIGLKRDNNYRNEYDEAKRKFNELKYCKYGDASLGNGVQQLIKKSYTRWVTPEWGLPKGRRSNKEFDLECAIREFVEETDIKYKNINVYKNVKPLEEIYKGINGVIYKHIYYLASVKDNAEGEENINQIESAGVRSNEIGNIKLFNLSECHKIIRPYYVSKLNVIKKGFQLINSINYFFE